MVHRVMVSAALAIAGALGLTSAACAGDKDKTRAILNKAIKAHGANKAAKFRFQTWKVNGHMAFGGAKQKYSGVYSYLAPNRFHFTMEMKMGEKTMKLTAASNGKIAWEAMAGKVRNMAKEKAQEFDHQVYTMSLTSLTPLRRKVYKLTALDPVKVKDKAAVGFKVQRKGKRDVSLYFDKKSGLLVKLQTMVISEFTKKETNQEVYLSNYAKKDGMMIFQRISIHQGGKEFIVEELSDQRFMKRGNPELFMKPKG